MGLPGQRRTSSSKRRRAAHFALARLTLGPCAKCRKLVPRHAVCPHCGTYRGRVVVEPRALRRLKRQQRPSIAGGEAA